MPTTNECAILSAQVYNTARSVFNKLSFPDWTEIDERNDLGPIVSSRSGFAATAYQKGNEIVIAFKGTDFLLGYSNAASIDDLVADISRAFEFVSIELTQTTAHERPNHVH